MNEDNNDGMLSEIVSTQIPCAICVIHAVRSGVDYSTVGPIDIVGQHFGTGQVIHEAVTTFAGTSVCWYHVDDAAKAAGL